MVDLLYPCSIMVTIDREGRALQRCNPSARSMPGDGQEHRHGPVLLPSHPSSGFKATNLLAWGEAPNRAQEDNSIRAVGHMSRFVVRLPRGGNCPSADHDRIRPPEPDGASPKCHVAATTHT